MPIAQTLTENSSVPVKIWTRDIDLKSIDQLKGWERQLAALLRQKER